MVGQSPWALRWLRCLVAIGLALWIHPALGATAESEEARIDNVKGTVVKVGSFGFGLVPDDDPGTRYAPTEPLADAFRSDGLRVRFSGELGDPSDTKGRRWGTPLNVTHIEVLDSSGS